MHTRLNKLVPRNRARLIRGRWMSEISTVAVVGNAGDFRWCRNGSSSGYSNGRRSIGSVSSQIGVSQEHHPSNPMNFQRKSLHATAKSPLSSSMSSAQQEKDDFDENFEQRIEMFASSCLTRLLPDEIFYDDNGKRDSGSLSPSRQRNFNSLDLELGNDSVWDNTTEDFDLDDYDDDDDWIIEEEQIPSSVSNIETNPIDLLLQQEQHQQTPKRKKSAIEILRNFHPEDPPQSDDPEELQLWLECAAQREAVLKYQKLVDKARDRKAFDSMGLMQRYIVQWYQVLRDAIELRQKEYLSNQDHRRAKKRYGPFMCSLHPEKMAVILSQEAITQALMSTGSQGRDGVPLVKIAKAIGSAVEIEVISQRRIKQRFGNVVAADDEGDDEDDEMDKEIAESQDNNNRSISNHKGGVIESWKFSASHLKMFLEDLNRMDPSVGKGKRAIDYAMRRTRQAMNSDEEWSNSDIVHIGAALLSIFIEHAKVNVDGKLEPVFRVEKRWSRDQKSASVVVLNDNLFRLFIEEDFISWAASTTRHTPMIVPPSDWEGPRKGGYRWLQADLMRTHGSNFQKEALEHADLNQLFEGLNILGKTAWKINSDILKVAQYCWENNIAIGDIPSRTDLEVPPEPIRPERIDPDIYANKESTEAQAAIAAHKEYRDKLSRRLRIHQKNMDLRSLRCSAILKLSQAEKFKDFERIYFPYNLDFRGRAYPIPPHLSNVGSDLCRGMLTFAEAKPLGKRGLYWLKVHLANFAGMDKMSFDDRAKFVDDNMDKVRESVNNPFSEDPWWIKLDDPFQGLATCHEIIRAIDSGDPETYMSSLPVHMDGSCNGLQHYAALGRDTVGGKAVNLLKGEGPQDVYIGVMHEVIRRVAEEAARTVSFDTADPDSLSRKEKKILKHNRAAKLVNGLIDRGVVKRTVMTSVYGVTYVGARQQIQEKIEEKLEEKGYDVDEMDREIFAAAGYLATLTIEVMGDLFQGARKTQNWLADCARLISQQGHPVAWISPIGVPAIQPYRQKRPRTVVTVMQSVTVTDQNDDLPVHRSRQVTAFPPNYVHSLDSSHMLLTAMEMDRRGLSFSAVHDSFWTHACDIDEMNDCLRSCFIDLYSRPLLRDLKQSWELRYPEVEFPELPELGDLDLNEVKSATYFFQ